MELGSKFRPSVSFSSRRTKETTADEERHPWIKNASSIEGGLTESLIQKYIKLSNQERDNKQAFRQQIFVAAEMELFQKLPNLNQNDPNSLEWIGLLGQLKQLHKESPEADSVQIIIKRMMEKAEIEYIGNDEF